MKYRIYNYPWSGRLGRIAKCCIFCRRNDHYFTMSSASSTCLHADCPHRKDKNAKPIPELEKALKEEYERLAREWCVENNIDYDLTVKELYEKHNGPPDQDRPDKQKDKIVKWFDRFLITKKTVTIILTVLLFFGVIYHIAIEKWSLSIGYSLATIMGMATWLCLHIADREYKDRHKI